MESLVKINISLSLFVKIMIKIRIHIESKKVNYTRLLNNLKIAGIGIQSQNFGRLFIKIIKDQFR